MTTVTPVFTQRWLSGKHVGQSKPGQFALVRRGEFQRSYHHFTFLDGSTEDFCTIPGVADDKHWHPDWVPQGDYKLLPNVTEVSVQQSYENNGIKTAVIQCENVIYRSIVGVLGTYHAIQRGILSPYMGYAWLGAQRPNWSEYTEWYNTLQGGQISVYQGYGSDNFPSPFTGLVDDIDMTSNPDHMVITARDFGGPTLTEQRVYGYVKDPKIRPPITFADRLKTDELKKVGGAARASSFDKRYPPINVTKAPKYEWWSEKREAGNWTEWVEIRLPRGRYETFHVYPKFAGMEMYLSIYAKDRVPATPAGQMQVAPQKKAQVNNVDVDQGWVVLPGGGVVPGSNGGVPYVKKWDSVDNNAGHHRMGASFEVGENSILRVSFRNLHKHAEGDYRAAVKRLLAYQRKQKKEVSENKWILVDDAADIVKVALMWAGFKEWEVESFGARLKEPVVFHQSNFLADIIKYATEQGGYTFFMDGPTLDPSGLSIGVPIFRKTRALAAPGPMIEVRDDQLLTAIQSKNSRNPKATIIRARGREAKRSEGGTTLGEDAALRITASYTPPWTKSGELAGIIKHQTTWDRLLTTQLECQIMCILIALQMCLQAHTVQFETAGHPGIGLDQQLMLVDEGTGISGRVWTGSIETVMSLGEQASYKTSVGASLIDTPDMQQLVLDYWGVLVRAQAEQEKEKN